MSVVLCIPSARPASEANRVLALWRKQGYSISLWRDTNLEADQLIADQITIGPYPGYARACNALIASAFSLDPGCDWVVCGGDDTEPDLSLSHTADYIARQCSKHFLHMHVMSPKSRQLRYGDVGFDTNPRPKESTMHTFGVMQPTGDRYGITDDSLARYGADRAAYIDRICGSPWIGREFARRLYGGKGPWWPEYSHMFVDSELQAVAEKLGVLWQRRDLIHLHHHWTRENPWASMEDCPEFLRRVNSPEHWAESRALFDRRSDAGFPGIEATL